MYLMMHALQEMFSHAVICTQEVLVADTAPDQAEEPASVDDNVILDWKGDPMQINPGDKLPFGFSST